MNELIYCVGGFVAGIGLMMIFVAKQIKYKLDIKKAQKKGGVIVELEDRSGWVERRIEFPVEDTVVIDGKRYFLAEVRPRFDKQTNLKLYRFSVNDAYPEDFKKDLENDQIDKKYREAAIESWVNPASIEKILLSLSQITQTSKIEKYIKLILVMLAGIGGLVFIVSFL